MELKEIISLMHGYRDGYGLITQADKDGGDTLNRTGVYYSCLLALGVSTDDTGFNPETSLFVESLLLGTGLPFGRFRRHIAPNRWYSNPDNVTRDQMVPVEAAIALAKDRKLGRAHFWQRAKRLFFHFSTQNDGADAGQLKHKLPDLCTPSEFGTLIRATGYKFLYFLLPITDLFLLIDVKFSRSLNERSLYDADNQLLPQVLAAIDQPSFITEGVRRAYAVTDAADRLKSYYAEGPNKNGIKPLGEIAALAFERCVGGFNVKEFTK